MRVDVAPSTTYACGGRSACSINWQQVVQQGLSGFGLHRQTMLGSLFEPRVCGRRTPTVQVLDLEQAEVVAQASRPGEPQRRAHHEPQDTGMVEGAIIFAQNSKAGGVNVTVKIVDSGTIYGDEYLKRPFSADYWGRATTCCRRRQACSTAPFNETHWDQYSGHNRLESLQAGAGHGQREEARRDHQGMQRMEYWTAGSSIWASRPDRGDGPRSAARRSIADANLNKTATASARSTSSECIAAAGSTPHPPFLASMHGSTCSSSADAPRLVTLFVMSVLIFAATQALPGDAARSILGRSATPNRLRSWRGTGLDKPVVTAVLGVDLGVLTGDLGTSWRMACP